MIIRENIVEFNYLSNEQKWRYLKAYWSKASEFYGLKQELIIPDGQVHAQVSKLKAKPPSKIRRVIALKDWRWKLDPKMDGVREEYFKHDYADASWEKATLPHNVNYTPPDPVRKPTKQRCTGESYPSSERAARLPDSQVAT